MLNFCSRRQSAMAPFEKNQILAHFFYFDRENMAKKIGENMNGASVSVNWIDERARLGYVAGGHVSTWAGDGNKGGLRGQLLRVSGHDKDALWKFESVRNKRCLLLATVVLFWQLPLLSTIFIDFSL